MSNTSDSSFNNLELSSNSSSCGLSSNLSTKKYWNKCYKKELSNFALNNDVGEIWYGEENVYTILQWLNEGTFTTLDSTILDIGCGNGISLVYLACDGYKNLNGVDYSHYAIELAKNIAKKHTVQITYEVGDILNLSDSCMFNNGQYDICHDKGTYDAISLSANDAYSKQMVYIKNVHKLTKDDGIFIITSCNWTEEELIEQFKNYFEKHKSLPSPSFVFGGKLGKQVTILVLKKKI